MLNRLLCCSDTHGRCPPNLVEDGQTTAWLHGGDAYDGPAILQGDDEEPLPGDPIAEPVRAWLRSRTVPVFGVHGNHDVADPYRWFASIESVDGRAARIAPKLVVVGVGWSGEKYYELPGESDLRRVCDAARRQALRVALPSDHIILLTHYPPRLPGLFPLKPGASAEPGSEVLAELVRELRPALVVQGHEHFWFGRSASIDFDGRRMLVINPGRDGMTVVIDTKTGSARVT
jgi:Icc-related predicted phosphoesterase